MGLSILNRQFKQEQNVNGNTFALGNVSKKITETFGLAFDFRFESSTSELIMINDESSIKLLTGDWSDKGFVSGDVVTLTGSVEDSNGGVFAWTNSSHTIQNVQGNIMNFTTGITLGFTSPIGALMPQGQNTPLLVVNTSRTAPEQVTFYHNLILNDANSSTGSLLDGEVNKFVIEDTDTIPINDYGVIIQEGNKSGGRYVFSQCSFQRAPDVGTITQYFVTIVYFLLSYDESSFDEPSFFEIGQCLKPTIEIYGYPEVNNPNSALSITAFNPLANTGWVNENYNEGINDFAVDSVSITNASGDALSEIDHNQTNIISAIVSGSADFLDEIECVFEVIPPEDDFENNEFSNLDNSFLTYFRVEAAVVDEQLSFGKNGGAIPSSIESITNTTNTIQIDFTLTPNSDFTNYINNLNEEDRRYRISFVVQSIDGTENDNNSVTLVLKQGLLTEAPIPDQLFDGVVSQGFLNHVQSIGDAAVPNYVGRTEDDFVFTSKFNLDNNEVWEKMTLDIEVVKDSDGTSFDLFSSSINFLNNPNTPMVNGVIQIDETQALAQFLDAPDRNKIELKNTGVTAVGTYEVELIWSMMANWRYWITNNQAFTEFYDNTLEKDGKNQEWVRYLDLTGYTIRARVRLIKDDIAYYFGGNIDVSDYDDWAGASEITLYDENNDLVTALLDGQVMKVRADHVLNSGSWTLGNAWGWISQRGYEQDPNKRLSTFWDWTSQDNPLQPKAGETTATLEIVTTNTADDTARIECLIDTSLTNVNDFSLTSRIQSPSIPSCMHPLEWLIGSVEANAANESDYVATLNQILNKGVVTEYPICCPDCAVEYTDIFGTAIAWAFGTHADTQLIVDSGDPTPDACCYDSYKATTSYASCIATFDAEINALVNTTNDPDALLALNPSLLNAYTGGQDIILLTNLITNITTDTQIRYDLLFEIIDRGVVMKCFNDGAKRLTRL